MIIIIIIIIIIKKNYLGGGVLPYPHHPLSEKRAGGGLAESTYFQ